MQNHPQIPTPQKAQNTDDATDLLKAKIKYDKTSPHTYQKH